MTTNDEHVRSIKRGRQSIRKSETLVGAPHVSARQAPTDPRRMDRTTTRTSIECVRHREALPCSASEGAMVGGRRPHAHHVQGQQLSHEGVESLTSSMSLGCQKINELCRLPLWPRRAPARQTSLATPLPGSPHAHSCLLRLGGPPCSLEEPPK